MWTASHQRHIIKIIMITCLSHYRMTAGKKEKNNKLMGWGKEIYKNTEHWRICSLVGKGFYNIHEVICTIVLQILI